MDEDQMSSVDGWIRALRKEFIINTAEAKQKADRRRYDPSKDESVIDYYYDKINLLKSTDYYMDEDKMIDAIWLGLPEDFQIHLHYSEFCHSSLNEVRRMLADKDGAYRKATKRSPPLIGKARSRERRERRWKEKRDRSSNNHSPPRSYERSSRYTRSSRKEKDSRKDGKKTESFKRGGGGNNDRRKSRLSKKDLEKLEKDYPTPANLPKSEWRSDEKGRIMTRKCRFCNQWHYDYDCSQKPESYHLMLMRMDNLAVEGSDSGLETVDYSDGYSSSSSSSSEPSHGTYHVTPAYSSNASKELFTKSVKILKAEKYHVETLPPALAVGTGISYLSVKPCPIRAWVGTEPHGDAELLTGVADTGGSSFIQQSLIPPGFEIRPNPLNPRFRGIGEAETSTKGFVVLPVWLPNAAALSGDQKHAKVLLIWCEFQVIDSLGANYLLGRDALHSYGVNINESESHLLFPQCKPPVKIPILDGPSKFASKLNDNQVYCSHDFTIRPRE
jgi:hypothetical protein